MLMLNRFKDYYELLTMNHEQLKKT